MKSAQDKRVSDTSQSDSLDIGTVATLSTMVESQNDLKTISAERRSRYSMNYQSYEATRIQPGEQTRRMLDYMFPGYQKRDPRNWYEMQTQTDLGWYEVPSLIGTELIEGEPIEAYEDKIKSLDLGDDLSDYEGPTEKKSAIKKSHRSSVISKIWEGPPIKMSGKSSQEGFHLDVDDFYHEPQTILVPRDVIEHQELKMDIVPDDQGVPKVVIYLGDKDPSEVNISEKPESTVILFDGKEEFDRTSSGSEGEEEALVPEESKTAEPEPVTSSEDNIDTTDDIVAKDSMEVVPPSVVRIELKSDTDISVSKTEESSSKLLQPDERALQETENSIFLEPIPYSGSHEDVYEDVIPLEPIPPPKEPSPPPKEPTSPPKEITPPPREITPPPREITPPPREITPPPREITPPPREITPPSREITPPPREITPPPPPKEPTPPPKEPSPPPKKPSPPPKEPSPLVESPIPSPVPSIASAIEETPSPPPVTASIPSQTNSHVGSPPDRLFGPLENYPNDLEEESDKMVHSPPRQLPSPSKDESDDHPLKVTDDYPPYYSPPPREASEVSNWLEANILSEAKNLAAKSPKDSSPQKLTIIEPQLSTPILESSVEGSKISSTELEPKGSKAKTKGAMFRDDERLSNPRALEERFSIYYPPPKPKKKKVPALEIETVVPKTDDTLEEKAVNEWVDEEILTPAAVDNWVDKKILSKSKGPPSEKPIFPKTSSQTVVSPESADSDEERVDAWMEDEILKPAQVDNWVANKIMKPADKLSEGKAVSPLLSISSPQAPASSPQIPSSQAIGLHGPSFRSISSTTSRKSDASSPRISELPPSTVAPLPLIPPQPAPSPKDQRESSGRSIDVDERDVDSWITNELLEPAQVGAWIDKEIVQPAHSQKLVDDEQMKQAQVDAWIEKEIVQPAHSQKLVDQQIKPESVQRYVEEDIVKLVSVQPYADEKIMKPSPVKSFYGDEIIEPAKPQPYVGEDNVKPAADSREGTIIKSASPLEQPSPQRSPPSEEYSSKFAFKFPVSDDNMPAVAEPPSKTETPIVIPDENISTELPYDFKYLPEKQSPVEDSRVVEPTKKFQSPETYLSDMDLLGPFLPHPDHPDEYPQKMTEEMPTPLSQPKPMEGKQETYASRTPVKEKSEMNALQIPSRQPETSVEPVKLMPGTAISETPVKEKSETSSMKLPKHLPVEKTPTESLPISVTSLGRKPSLKQKSDSGSLSKMKQSGIEPEKKDRPSILAKKAIEADNYLLRDEDHDYVLPKMSSGTQLPEEKRRKSSDSKKLCPLTNLFKRKRSSQDSQGFKPSSFIKRESAEDDDKGKHQAKQLSSIDEEDFIIPPKGASIRPSSTGKKPDEDLSKRNVAPSSPKAKPVDSSDPEGISVTTKSIVDYPPFVPSISIISKTPDSTPQISEVPSSAKTIPPSTIQSTVEPPGQKTVPKHAQAKSESIPHLHTPKDGLAKFPKESPLVAPEELFDAFPEFPDRDELLKNRKKPRKDEVKALPNPPKSGFPMFPDYRQLIDPQIETQLTDVSSSKENPEVGLFSETNEDMEHQGDDEGESPMDRNSTASSEKILDPHSVPQVTVKSEEALKIKEKSIKKSDEFKNISVTLTDESRKEPSIPQVAPPKDSVGYIQDSNEPESTKHDVTTEKRCWSTEPTPPGDGVPKFSDYHEMTIGPDNILPKPQNEPTPWVHQIPASFSDGSPRSQQIAVAQELTSQQQPATQPSRSQGPNAPHSMQIPSTTPPIFEQQPHITPEIEPQEYRPNQLLQIPQTQQQPYAPNEKAYIKPYEEQASQTQLMQAPSFKKYDYSQPEKPVQRMSVPMGQQILNSGERGGLQSQPEYYGQSPSQTQKNMLADGSVPLPQQNISPYGGSVGTPTYTMPPLQIKPEWRRPYHSTPQQQPSTFPEGYVSVKQRAPQQSPGSPNGQIQQQAPGIPYGKVSQTQQTHPSADSPLAPQGPIQQQFAYEKPTSSYRAPPSAGKLPPPSFSQYGPVRNQDPYSGPPTSPYSKPYQYTTNQPVAPPYSGYGPFQQTPYGGPATRPYSTAPGSVQPQLPYSAPTTSSYKPGTEKLRNAPDFSPYNQIPQQAPTDKSIKYKKPEIQKHTYTHPEKPLPLAPVRPRGIEDKDLSPEKGSPKTSATAGLDHGPIFERQTTPIEPGGGVPRFPDYEPVSEPTLKAPTMTGDFRKTPQKPKMVTAADKRAEFDMEIQPIMQQIQDLKRQMYELTPQKGPPIRTGPEHGRPLPSSMQLYNELEKRTLAATKFDREGARAERRKQQYEANVRRKIEREIERSRQSK